MLFRVIYFILTKERISGDDGRINITVEVLDGHEIFCDALAELVVEEFQADLVCLLEWFIKEIRAITYRSSNDFKFFGPLGFEAAVGTSYSVHYGFCWFNFLCLKLLLWFGYFSLAVLHGLNAVTRTHIYILLKNSFHSN